LISSTRKGCEDTAPTWGLGRIILHMKQPKGFTIKSIKELVCKLKNTLYALKKSPGI